MDTLYEFKKELYEMINNKEVPVEVETFVNIAKRNLKEIYLGRNLLNSNMEQYIDTQFEALKPYIKRILEDKNSQDFEKINATISQIGLRIEEPSQNAKAFDVEAPTDREFLGKANNFIMLTNTREENQNAAKNIIGYVIDVINDIRNHGMRVADKSQSELEELDADIRQLRNYISAEMPQELVHSLDKDDQKMLTQVTEVFEKYFYIEKNRNENENDDKSFREELDAGISLEQQSENAKAFMDAQDEKNEETKPKGLPDNVLE